MNALINANVKFSDDNRYVIISHHDFDDEEILTIREFEEIYGVDMHSPEIGELIGTANEPVNIIHYWATFKRLVDVCGKYASASKRLAKAPLNSPKLQSSAKYYDNLRHALANALNSWSQRIGYPPLSTEDDMKRLAKEAGEFYTGGKSDVEFLLSFLNDPDNRRKTHARIKRYTKRLEKASAKELITDIKARAKNTKN